MTGTIKVKRAYDPVSKDDGFRVLIGRLWPRGVSRSRIALDLWLKDIAPSTELREWFGHDPGKWGEFRSRYWRELDGKKREVATIMQKLRTGPVTLIYSARDREHNAAVALKEYLEQKVSSGLMASA
ncbi:DUF488 domain-containing protein [Methanocella arvoryzae]|uniref:DUF488 domain-containing protein n=1 Tax=Methanocella arvoryzae (strain DSM 22066 / NBRC 105507 / MRE50) TaxID=351160 RepID=Q0W098_METAR|nr:DUF488 domain-containing protein [Methanocella arvoryzae]CAJ38195.1 conserved hypothetical protein [Methanocella arvoryzae MRE50]